MDDDAPLSEDDAEAYLSEQCVRTAPPRWVGVELEWLVHDRHDPLRRVPHGLLTTAIDTVAVRHGKLTIEPGGQLEYSSRASDGLDACVAASRADLAVVRFATATAGLQLTGSGADAGRGPRRVLHHPRYAAMEEFFDRSGDAGRAMMCGTASVQVCLDAGADDEYQRRWQLAHALGPVLVAAFANSPLWRGRPSGWRSTRQAIWSRIDRSRTRPVGGADPREVWPRYALDAQVLCVRRPAGQSWTAPPDLTFRRWLRGAGEYRPTRADLDYHLTTVFPPVRPRGYLELRMVDAQHDDDWIVPLAVCTALLDDPVAARRAWAATRAVARAHDDPWLSAARHGLSDAVLASAARECFAAATEALDRWGAAPAVRAAVNDFVDRYVSRGRCPADDVLERRLPLVA